MGLPVIGWDYLNRWHHKGEGYAVERRHRGKTRRKRQSTGRIQTRRELSPTRNRTVCPRGETVRLFFAVILMTSSVQCDSAHRRKAQRPDLSGLAEKVIRGTVPVIIVAQHDRYISAKLTKHTSPRSCACRRPSVKPPFEKI